MLTVTEEAGVHLVQLIEARRLPEESAIRLVCEGEGIGLEVDTEQPGDATFQHDGRLVLLLDAEMTALLDDDTLDLEDGMLALVPPKENARPDA